MTDEIKKMLEPTTFAVPGLPREQQAIWIEDFDRLKRGFLKLLELYGNSIRLCDKLSRELEPTEQTKTVEDVMKRACSELLKAMRVSDE